MVLAPKIQMISITSQKLKDLELQHDIAIIYIFANK